MDAAVFLILAPYTLHLEYCDQMCGPLTIALSPALLAASTVQPCRNAILLLSVFPWALLLPLDFNPVVLQFFYSQLKEEHTPAPNPTATTPHLIMQRKRPHCPLKREPLFPMHVPTPSSLSELVTECEAQIMRISFLTRQPIPLRPRSRRGRCWNGSSEVFLTFRVRQTNSCVLLRL